MLDEFAKQGDIDRYFAHLTTEAPAVKQAEAKLEAAKRELAQAELDLRYCDIVAEIDGVVTRRNVNPGDYVQIGQNLMAIRSLHDIWVDANFKETELRDLRIGQAAELYVDMYGGRHVFKGRVSGFTMGTGSTLALLPAQNATGNFVKVVQRLPVRIDLEGYDPDKNPLFIGTSVVPYVYINKPPTGPDAGKFLQTVRASITNRAVRPAARRAPTNDRSRHFRPLDPFAAGNSWLLAAVVVVPTFMEVLDTTIALVALRYIAGGLSATVDDGEWVITSYLAANAVILPITGWLSAHLGRRNYFLASIAIFTLSSLLCGFAGSLGQLILFRVIQGLAGGGLQPSSQGVLLDAFPREKQGVAMTLFGFAALIAPIVGPTLGGWITDSYSWRWIFLINVPVGLLAFAGCYALLRDPDYLVAQRAELRKQPFHFDAIGLSLLVIVMVCWEVMLSKGQEWDWLGDPFWRVQTLAICFARGFGWAGLLGIAAPQPSGQFPTAGRTQLRGLLHHHLLRLPCALCGHQVVARSAAIPVWLRCTEHRTGHVAEWHLCGDSDADCRPPDRPENGCSLADRRGPAAHDRRELLDVPAQPRHQPGRGRLASRARGRGTGGVLCSRECRRLSLYADGVAWCRCRLIEPPAQRGRQRRGVVGSNLPRAA